MYSPIALLPTIVRQTSFPVFASSATRTASVRTVKTLSPYNDTPRLTGLPRTLVGTGLRYRHRTVPDFASSARTWLNDVETNITPPLTIGAASCPLFMPVDSVHTGWRRATFFVLI